jgi:hypothetical protein
MISPLSTNTSTHNTENNRLAICSGAITAIDGDSPYNISTRRSLNLAPSDKISKSGDGAK